MVLPLFKGELEGVEEITHYRTPPTLPLKRGGENCALFQKNTPRRSFQKCLNLSLPNGILRMSLRRVPLTLTLSPSGARGATKSLPHKIRCHFLYLFGVYKVLAAEPQWLHRCSNAQQKHLPMLQQLRLHLRIRIPQRENSHFSRRFKN